MPLPPLPLTDAGVSNNALVALLLGQGGRSPQPELQCNPELPAQKLSYDGEIMIALPLDPSVAAPLPDGAQVRFTVQNENCVSRAYKG